MRLQIRYIGSRETTQQEFDGSVATIGRGGAQVIQVTDQRLPPVHSSLSVIAGKLTIAATAGQNFVVGGISAKKRVLEIGEIVDISGHAIEIKLGEGEVDYILEVTLDEAHIQPLKERHQIRLRQTNSPLRQISWLLFVVCLMIGLLIPVAGLYFGIEGLRESPLPDDSMWLTGKLHQSHVSIGDDCSQCHTEVFTQVKDEDCLSCHQSINHHFDTQEMGQDYKVGDGCGDCHKEHSTTDSITRTDQEVCTTCHADMEKAGFSVDRLRPVADFLDDHPTFKVAIEHLNDQGVWQTTRMELADDSLKEQSNLIFPHDKHLDENGINSADGSVVMVCKDCHEPEKGGLRMKPVTMEQHCADCHELTFDPDTPDRVVPHGSPPDLMRTLREYYAYQYLTKDKPKPEKSVRPAEATLDLDSTRPIRRPGRKSRPTSIVDLIVEQNNSNNTESGGGSSNANAYIEARVANAAANLFEKQTCTVCHEITPTGDRLVPWEVKPVRLNAHWMPLTVFSHSRHKNMQCADCHEATLSKSATDVIMPDIDGCRTCHGGEANKVNLLNSTCITCHDFHLESQKPMGELIDTELIEGIR